MHVAVIGAGLMGASVAYHLARAGVDVTVIDPQQPGQATSGASFACVNASTPEINDRRYFELCARAVEEHDVLAGSLGGGWLHRTGHLRWADPASPQDGGALLEHARQLRERGYQAEEWDPAEVTARLEPGLVIPRQVSRVVYFPREAWIDAPALAAQLVAVVPHRIAEYVTGISLSGDRVRALRLSSGAELRVDAVVNAAGPWSGHVASLAGRELPLAPSSGLVARLATPTVPVRRAMHAGPVEIRPDGTGRVLLHSRRIDARLDTTRHTGDRLIRDLIGLAVAVVPPLAAAELADARVGCRPMPADTYPSVGAVAATGAYYELVGHHGATLAPLLGRLLATEIRTGELDDRLAPYRPGRPSLTATATGPAS
ncbi:MAG TPA: FAD-dependent oxidoreductase [Streptosporangiaceae bacterium]|jgi:glycine/D-amino acid oxidase-like deaminating enzyme